MAKPSCSICFEDFEIEGDHEPYNTGYPNCSHVFCKQCLLRMIQASKFECPLCRGKPHKTPSSLKDFPVASLVVDLLKYINSIEKQSGPKPEYPTIEQVVKQRIRTGCQLIRF